MAETIMAMLIASASVEINMVSPFVSFFVRFDHSTSQGLIWLPCEQNYFSPGALLRILGPPHAPGGTPFESPGQNKKEA